jgi:hypothetical protein
MIYPTFREEVIWEWLPKNPTVNCCNSDKYLLFPSAIISKLWAGTTVALD